jgi:hypothetical protein
MANNKKKTEKTQKQIDEEILAEKLELLQRTDEVKGQQLFPTADGQLVTAPEISINSRIDDINDPQKKFDIYYNYINKILKRALPKGKSYKKQRDYIYEEKNVVLTRGKRIREDGTRGADGRMGYIIDAEEVLEMVTRWEKESGKMVDLFNLLHTYNIGKGYGKRF